MLLEFANRNDLKILHREARKGEVRHSVADISKAREKLRYRPKVDLKNGLKRLLAVE